MYKGSLPLKCFYGLLCIFLSFIFITSFAHGAEAQSTLTGLGYVDTNTFSIDNVDNYVGNIVTDSNNDIYIFGDIGTSNSGGMIDLDWNEGKAEYYGDIFIAKYSPNRELIFGIVIDNPTGWIISGDIVVDDDGNIYISGDFGGSVDFDFTDGTALKIATGGEDAYLMKILANGTFGWVQTFGGSQNDYLSALAIDTSNHVLYGVGTIGTTNVDINPGVGVDTKTQQGVMLVKYDLDGNYIGGNVYGDTRFTSVFIV